jgi:hypothetical protein
VNAGIRREVTGRELGLLVAGACLLSIVMHWPLILHLGETVPRDIGDPLPQAWQAAWDGHALAHRPLDLFQANQFWPFRDTLAFSDALVGYAPAGLVGSGPHAAVVRYDLLFLFAYALAFVGAYLLARELGVGPWGAVVAGAAFAFAPFRLEQDGHLQVISSGGIPLALALAVRGARRASPGAMVAAWLVAAWQVSIGFSLGLPFMYLLLALAAIGAVVWGRRGRPPPPRRMLLATAAGALVFVACVGLRARRRPLLAGDPFAGHGGRLLGTTAGVPGRTRGEPDLGPGDRRAARRPLEHSGEDAVPGLADPRPRRGRGPVGRMAAPPRLEPCRRGAGDLDPRARLPRTGRAAVARPDRL